MNLLRPEFYVKSIYSINFEKLKAMNINNLIIDIDNTLMPWGSKAADEKVTGLIEHLIEEGFKICFLSNSSRTRIQSFIGKMGVVFFSGGRKPMRRMFIGAMKRLGSTPLDTCVIGDQIFTDVLGGNRCRLHTILVDPIVGTEFMGTRFLRKLEYRLRRDLKYEGKLMHIE